MIEEFSLAFLRKDTIGVSVKSSQTFPFKKNFNSGLGFSFLLAASISKDSAYLISIFNSDMLATFSKQYT